MKTNDPSKNEKWVLITAVLASAMAFIDATALNVALPAIQAQTGATGTELFWILNAYAVVTAALILFGGALGDRFGYARVLGLGIGVFVLASCGCGLASGTRPLIYARTFQGFGAAMMIPGSLALISNTFEACRRGRAIGIWSACSVVMTALGPILGGVLSDAGWWRAIFLINLPIGVLSVWVLRSKVSSAPRGEIASLDYTGAVLSILCLASFNFAFLEVTTRGWTDTIVVSSFASGCLLLVMFIWHEARHNTPLLPLALFDNGSFCAACQLTICLYSGLYGMLFFLALNLIQVQGYSAALAGAAQLPVMVLVIVFSPLAGSLTDRYGPRLPLMIGGVLATSGFLVLCRPGLTRGPIDYWVTFLPPLLLLGAALGMSAAPMSATIMNSVTEQHFGIASGVNSMLARLSGVLGIAVLGPLSILAFRQSLSLQVALLGLDDAWARALQVEALRFADAVPPAGMPAETTAAIQRSIHWAYINAFRLASALSAGCVAISTLLATAILTGQRHVGANSPSYQQDAPASG